MALLAVFKSDEDLRDHFAVFLGTHACTLVCVSKELRLLYKKEAARWHSFAKNRSSLLRDICQTVPKFKKAFLVVSADPKKKTELIEINIAKTSDVELEVAKLAIKMDPPFRIGVQFNFIFGRAENRYLCVYVAE